jgi:hypothetical protein
MIELVLQGGLGNQLFQWSTAKSLSHSLNVPLKINTSLYHSGGDKRNFTLNTVIKNVDEVCQNRDLRFSTSTHKVAKYLRYFSRQILINDTNIEQMCNDNMRSKNLIMKGYFQNYVAFDNIRTNIIKQFKNNSVLQQKKSHLLQVAIHVRRTDYLELKNIYTILDQQYYINACNLFVNKFPEAYFFLIGDDKEFMKNLVKSLRIIGFNCEIPELPTNDDIADFEFMRQCGGHIIANSTFSWWAAYSAPGTRFVVAPKQWFSSGLKRSFDYPKTWELL